eukprot:2187117-Pyramimonas_sp.AAC.1
MDLNEAGPPRYFTRGTKWANIPCIVNVGLSCRRQDNPQSKHRAGRSFMDAYNCLVMSGSSRIYGWALKF